MQRDRQSGVEERSRWSKNALQCWWNSVHKSEDAVNWLLSLGARCRRGFRQPFTIRPRQGRDPPRVVSPSPAVAAALTNITDNSNRIPSITCDSLGDPDRPAPSSTAIACLILRLRPILPPRKALRWLLVERLGYGDFKDYYERCRVDKPIPPWCNGYGYKRLWRHFTVCPKVENPFIPKKLFGS